jgi:nucleotide-binding universal stress UspA family protein
MYKRILLAYDGSKPGQAALLDCREIAALMGAELFVVAVIPPPMEFAGGEVGIYDSGAEESDRKQYRDILDEGLKRLADAGRSATGEVVMGDAVDEIAKHAAKVRADLIVVGHRHVDGWAARWWRGSVSKSLVEHAGCSVLVVVSREPG